MLGNLGLKNPKKGVTTDMKRDNNMHSSEGLSDDVMKSRNSVEV